MGNYADMRIFGFFYGDPHKNIMGIPIKTSWGYYADLRFQKTGHPAITTSPETSLVRAMGRGSWARGVGSGSLYT